MGHSSAVGLVRVSFTSLWQICAGCCFMCKVNIQDSFLGFSQTEHWFEMPFPQFRPLVGDALLGVL